MSNYLFKCTLWIVFSSQGSLNQNKTKDTSSVGSSELLPLLLKKHYCQSKSIYTRSERNVHRQSNVSKLY